MIKLFSKFHFQSAALLPTGLLLLLIIVAALPTDWNDKVADTMIDLQLQLRGPRQAGEDIVLVYIGAVDDSILGGWPITRDYYGYLMHVLVQTNARAIGFDILFDEPDRRYPEYDEILSGFFASTNNVCLPFVFAGGLSATQPKRNSQWPSLLAGTQPIYPTRRFAESLAGMGFSNFGAGSSTTRIPVIARTDDSLSFSFGFELARVWLGGSPMLHDGMLFLELPEGTRRAIPLDRRGRLLINHFGGVEQIQTISLVELLKRFEASPDSIDLRNKLVLVAVSSPGRTIIKGTALAAALPASLLHLAVAENIVHENFLRELSWRWNLILVSALAALAIFIAVRTPLRKGWLLTIGVLLLYWLAAIIAVRMQTWVLPLFYPTLAVLSCGLLASGIRHRQQLTASQSIQSQLRNRIEVTEQELEQTYQQLAEVKRRMTAASDEKAALSEQNERLVEEQHRKTIALEKQLRDLRVYAAASPVESPVVSTDVVHAAGGKMQKVLELVARVSRDDIPVLLAGETGTGKELIAHAIHHASERQRAPFIAVNCGALPEGLLESELFGHEKGSFTGAVTQRRGRFELADGGTLFLDEVTETSTAFQARLLRVLQDKTFERIGGEKSITVNLRIIAASSRDLAIEVEQGRFRADLFYRLNGFPIRLPALRERTEDIPVLFEHFLRKHGYHPEIAGASDTAISELCRYHWPGNVRELENLVRRAAILAKSDGRRIIQSQDLAGEISRSLEPLPESVSYLSFEQQVIDSLRALQFSRSAISQTARALGNRDRGTITEYFRGICFEHLVNAGFDLDKATKAIAGCDDPKVLARVHAKLAAYLNNLPNVATGNDNLTNDSSIKGLPQKFHPYLRQVVAHISQTSPE